MEISAKIPGHPRTLTPVDGGYIKLKNVELYIGQGDPIIGEHVTMEELSRHVEDALSGPRYDGVFSEQQKLVEAAIEATEHPRPEKSEWEEGVYVFGGDIVSEYETYYQLKVGKDHLTQWNYRPSINPSLWDIWVDPDQPQEWVAGGSYPKDAKVIHNGFLWLSGVDNNIWEPGAEGVYENIWENIGEV